MLVAKKLRGQNITAYVIYMFQVEDVIRAYGLDVDRIVAEYLPRFHYDEAQTKEVAEWYGGLVRMMHEEGCERAGHVQVVRNTILLMTDRHQELLHDAKQPFYSAAYYKLKMQGREISTETQVALQPITHWLELLAQLYNEHE